MGAIRGILEARSLLARWRDVVVPLGIGGVAVGVAYAGALLTGDGITGANAFVENLSGNSSTQLNQLSVWLPVGFAFGAGMVSTVNPCGFAMLPAYLGLYLGGAEESAVVPAPRRLTRALIVGGSVTLGFMLLFGVVGLIIGSGSQAVVGAFPWIGLGVGVVLTFGGAWLLRGGSLYTSLAERAASRMGDPSRVGVRGYFVFGLSYGTASLSCTLPIFLLVVTSTFVVGGFFEAVGQFIVYALGMGSVLMVLTLSMALFKGVMRSALRRVLPYIAPVSAVLMLVAGTYIVYYWLTLGELLEKFPGA